MINADVDGSGVLVLIDEGVGEAFVRGGRTGEVMPLPLVPAATSICWLFFFLAIANEFEKMPKKTISVRRWLHFASINFDKRVEGDVQASLGTELVPQFPLLLQIAHTSLDVTIQQNPL